MIYERRTTLQGWRFVIVILFLKFAYGFGNYKCHVKFVATVFKLAKEMVQEQFFPIFFQVMWT
jgi:hypothetical protein